MRHPQLAACRITGPSASFTGSRPTGDENYRMFIDEENRAHEYLAKAEECERRAELLSDGMLRQAFSQLAKQWRDLARASQQSEI